MDYEGYELPSSSDSSNDIIEENSIDIGDSIDVGDSIDIGDSIDVGDSIDIGDSIDVGDSIDIGDSIDVRNSMDIGDSMEMNLSNKDIDIGDESCLDNDVEKYDLKDDIIHIESRNEDLEGCNHPETGVPFERREVEIDGKRYDVVAPRFESEYDASLPEDKLQASDREQFKECNSQLRDSVEKDKMIGEKFDDDQIEQIENGDTPDGYTWHHDIDVGKMQLVDTEIHQKTGHTGGRSIWGGGSDKR